MGILDEQCIHILSPFSLLLPSPHPSQIREREHLSELQRIEEEISRQRLNTLNSLETAAKDEMDLMDKVSCYWCSCVQL